MYEVPADSYGKVYAEATIAFPLIVAATFAKVEEGDRSGNVKGA